MTEFLNSRKIFKKIICFISVFSVILGCLSLNAYAEEDNRKTISILGDSISTYLDISNNITSNSTIGDNLVYYVKGKTDVNLEDTWWQQAIDFLDLKLLVNNSWSGSCVYNTRAGTVGAYIDRCVQLHNDYSGEKPDIIAVFLGTNDFLWHQASWGRADDIDYSRLITEDIYGEYIYSEPETTCEAYAIILHKISVKYPEAQVYCMTLFPQRDPDFEGDAFQSVGQPDSYNTELGKIISKFGFNLVDLQYCGIDKEAAVFDKYMSDYYVHPNKKGMDKISLSFIENMLGYKPEICDISFSLKNSIAYKKTTLCLEGSSYITEISPEIGYCEPQVKVIMGDVDITADCYENGVINIPYVSSDVEIIIESKINLDDYISPLPEVFCSGTNIWNGLKKSEKYYSSGWKEHNSGALKSVTIPVESGQKIYASSFEEKTINGGNSDGVRITFFDENDVLISLTPQKVYNEFKENGYITVPNGAKFVNIPMWDNDTKSRLSILDREHLYSYQEEIEPTCNRQGYTKHYCEYCEDTYNDSYEFALGYHLLEDDKCIYCNKGAESEHRYPLSYDGNWNISRKGAKSISITFSERTYVENEGDYIYLYDNMDNLIGRYTGDELAGKTVTVKGDMVKIKLYSDEKISAYGFKVTDIVAVYENGDLNGNGEYDLQDYLKLKKYTADDTVSIKSSADVNSDGKTDALDLITLKNYILE